MDKLKMQSLNKVDENIEKIGRLFPNCLTERKGENGEIEHAIDFDMLRQELSSVVVEGNEERYQFTWPDKKKSVLLANAPIAKTLRPCREESVDFDNTENLYIEGDNLDVLKLLQETYLGKVKMIYIDPPYNTGNDFVYEDDFAQSTDEYLENSGQYDENGNRLVKNLDSNGRFHTDWLNMIHPRLKLAKDLLREDGVIFISIDDNEVDNLIKLGNEVYGESNYVGCFPWRKRTAKSDVPFGVSQDYEWVLCFAKSNDFIAGIAGGTRKYFETEDFPNRPWRIHDLTKQTSASERPNSFFTIVNPKTGEEYPANPNRTWVVTTETIEKYIADDRIVFPGDYDFLNISRPAMRYFQEDDAEKSGERFGFIPVSTKLPEDIGMTQDGTKEITAVFENKVFGFPKPIALIKHLINATTATTKTDENIILDFFSGSATTAHAVMQLNAEDGGNRKFIMVQIAEETDEKSEAYKAGYKNICEIGKERIRRAGAKIQAENDKLKDVPLIETEEDATLVAAAAHAKGKQGIEQIKPLFEQVDISNNLDTGFRVLKLDSTNMKDVYYNPADYEADLFDTLTDNIKDDRTPEDLLFQVMLDLGVLLSSKIEESTIAGKKVFDVADGFLIACFDDNITEETIKAIAQKKPYYFVMRDSSMANDSVATNFEQVFATYSPETVRKVL